MAIFGETTKEEWKVYRIDNHTKKQSYFGATSQEIVDRFAQHCAGNTQTLKDLKWNCDKDKLTISKLGTFISKEQASRKAHEFERTGSGAPGGFSIIQTGGT